MVSVDDAELFTRRASAGQRGLQKTTRPCGTGWATLWQRECRRRGHLSRHVDLGIPSMGGCAPNRPQLVPVHVFGSGRKVHSGVSLLAQCAVEPRDEEVACLVRCWRRLGGLVGCRRYSVVPGSPACESAISRFHARRNDAWRSFNPCSAAGGVSGVHRPGRTCACSTSLASRR